MFLIISFFFIILILFFFLSNLIDSTDNSKNTSIDSVGFDIIENGNIINFKGKTKLVLK